MMKQDGQAKVLAGAGQAQDPHRSLHSETGARPGEHPGRSGNPLVKVAGLAWLEFEKPDLDRAERFGTDFGFTVADRTPDTLLLRGRSGGRGVPGGPPRPAAPVRRGRVPGGRPRTTSTGWPAAPAGRSWRTGAGTPSGCVTRAGSRCASCYGVPDLPALPGRAPLPLNFGSGPARVNATQRPARRPAEIQRLGHVVLGTTRFRAALDWYLDTLGLIVSDFLYLDGQRDRGPAMAFIRCDLGSVPADHHTLAMALQPHTGYVHSAYQLTDLDEVAASGEYLRERGYRHAWGLGRHIQGSQIFDYWRDPDRVMFEHYTDGDVFDAAMEPGWAPLSVSGLAQWGPKATAEFTGTNDPRVVVAAIKALRDKGNEVDLRALRGLIKAMGS